MSTDWREKYLSALEQQEQLEQQQDLDRRALIRLSLAADGLDEEMDTKLKGVRHVLRPQQGKQPVLSESQLAELEEAILGFEKRRAARRVESLDGFKALSTQLQALDQSSDSKKALKGFQKSLKQRLTSVQEYPRILRELIDLQQQALAAEAGVKKPGFISRLLGGDKDDSEEQGKHTDEQTDSRFSSDNPAAAETLEDSFVEGRPGDAIENRASNAGESSAETRDGAEAEGGAEDLVMAEAEEGGEGLVIEGELSDEEPSTEAVFQRPVHEPAFSKISEKVTRVLTDLLDNVEAMPSVVQKVDNARERVLKGLNWFELVPTLEDIRDLVMQAYLDADRAHGEYLVHVEGELAAILEALGGAASAESKARLANERFQADIGELTSQMGQALASATDLAELQSSLNGQIDAIHTLIDDFTAANSSEGQPLSAFIEDLVNKAQHFESEARQSREDFEEQRRIALEDALTGLPNRQAYNERIHHEKQRWQRYSHPLTLAVCDIDLFKRVNDSYGHQAGDRVIRVIGRSINKRLREVDFMARFGGEEFVIVMPETTGENGHKILDKIRAVIAETPFHFKEEPVQITLSMGVASFAEGDTAESVFERADKALYAAKEGGRNLCRLATVEASDSA